MNKSDNILNNKQDAHPQAGPSSSKGILKRGEQHAVILSTECKMKTSRCTNDIERHKRMPMHNMKQQHK